MVTLYTTHCPKCNVLTKKLDSAGIEYNLVDDVGEMIDEGIMTAPVLEVDGEKMDYKQAVDWVNEQGD